MHEDELELSAARERRDEREIAWSGVISWSAPEDVPDVSRFFWTKRSLLRRLGVACLVVFAAGLATLATAVADNWFFEAAPVRE